ncbi:12665_t:CDS:2 [Entrophospora sp. SA101]|nr:12665_t:CDS:2 [Entrophospora sp. SA101]
MTQINLISSFFVIYQTLQRVKLNSNLSMGVRLPMYIAINNALSAVSYSANAIGTLVIGIPWAGKACKIYGFFDTFIISMR